jgi:hypothetical protein
MCDPRSTLELLQDVVFPLHGRFTQSQQGVEFQLDSVRLVVDYVDSPVCFSWKSSVSTLRLLG